MVLFKYKSLTFVFEEDHQKGQNISTLHILLISLVDFYFLARVHVSNFSQNRRLKI